MKLYRIASLTLSWSFLVLIFSSLVLFVVPSGKIAHWSNWAFLGLDKEGWGALHTNTGYLFILAGLFHLLHNWKQVLMYLRNRRKELTGANGNSLQAFGLVLGISVMTVTGLPPVSYIQDLNHRIKEAGETQRGNPPYGHAEESSLVVFCQRTGQDLETALASLAQAGYKVASPEDTLSAISQANGVTPQLLAEAILGKQAAEEALAAEKKGGGNGAGGGWGRMTLAEFCAAKGLDPAVAQGALRERGWAHDLSLTVKAIAEKQGVHPSEVISLLTGEDAH